MTMFLSDPYQAFYREDGTAVCHVQHAGKSIMRTGRTTAEAYDLAMGHFTLFERMTMTPNGIKGQLRICEIEIEALRRALRDWQGLSVTPPSY